MKKGKIKVEVTYDPNIIATYAKELYRRANSVTFFYAFLGLIFGFAVGFAFFFLDSLIPNYFTAAFGCWIGYTAGMAKSFALRLEAQQALCQLQIELNTRRG
jgi:hypothetical protein